MILVSFRKPDPDIPLSELKMQNDKLERQRAELKDSIKDKYTRTVASIKERTKAAVCVAPVY